MSAKDKRRLIASRDAIVQELHALIEEYAEFDVVDDPTFEQLLLAKDELESTRTDFVRIKGALNEIGESDIPLYKQFLKDYHAIFSVTNAKLKSYAQQTQQHNDDRQPPVTQPNFVAQAAGLRLPEIPIPTFAGTFEHWLHFRDTFTNIIIDNAVISDATKFYYLRQALSGEALARIQNIPPGDHNFQLAWKLLTERYDNVRLIAASHVSGLESPPSPIRNSAKSLRAFIDHCKGHINALMALNLGVSITDILFSHTILSHLDTDTRCEWERHLSCNTIPTLDALWGFLENNCKVWEIVAASSLNQPSTGVPLAQRPARNYNPPPSKQNFQRRLPTPNCLICNLPHYLYQCSTYHRLSPSERLALVNQKGLCINCLKPNVHNHYCSTGTCSHCNKKHNSSLHEALTSANSISKPRTQGISNFAQCSNEQFTYQNEPSTSSRTMSNKPSSPFETSLCGDSGSSSNPAGTQCELHRSNNDNVNRVNVNTCSAPVKRVNKSLLPTVQLHIQDAQGKFHMCSALLDSGSDCNLLSYSLLDILNLPQSKNDICVQGICNKKSIASTSVSVNLKSPTSSWSSTQNCIIVPQITSDLPTSPVILEDLQIPENLSLADPNFYTTKRIDLLLGASFVADILAFGQIKIGDNHPILQNTKLGWIVLGSLPTNVSSTQTFALTNHVSTSEINEKLERFWKLEEIASKSISTPDEQMVEEHFQTTTYRQPDGRYSVALPRKPKHPNLGHSRTQALKRFHSLEKRLARHPELKEQYCTFMSEYQSLGHMSVAPPALPEQTVFYIPHHPVFKPDSTTTKLRVVFDASAKTSTSTSLNDILHVGPTVQPELFETILRFRFHPIAFIADVTKMYRQVLIQPQDYDLQRIFWRSDPSEPLEEFHLVTVTYGTAPAAFLATRSLVQLAHDEASNSPTVFRAITQDFYVDDLISGANSTDEAILLSQQLSTTLSKGGFELRKWLSNAPQVTEQFPPELCETEVSKLISGSNDSIAKALGLFWNASRDELLIASNISHLVSKTTFTKREFLSCVASIFDPLGLISPVVTAAKILFQQLWLLKLDWDDNLPTELLSQWLAVLVELPSIASISIPRCVIVNSNPENIQIHGFCDASIKAYGACVYLRSTSLQNMPTVRLLCAKSRVAPLKPVSISRLELCAALLLSRLVNKVLRILTFSASSIHLWTDSTNVLTWLQSPPQRKNVFVSLRVVEIQEDTKAFHWHHVKSVHNPADLISRGTSPKTLQSSTLWWQGPTWLLLDPIPIEYLPREITLFASSSAATLVTSISAPSLLLQVLNHYSTFSKVLRIIALCCRFTYNTRHKDSRQIGSLNVSELKHAELLLAKATQSEAFASELNALTKGLELPHKSPLIPFSPILHKDGLIRVGGRLNQANLAFDTKHQILLPKKHKFTKLLVVDTHLRLLHAGTQSVVADIRQTYWILSSRRTVRDILRHCIPCFRFQPIIPQQQMGQLPPVRITPASPFINCGTDYAGPLLVKHGGPRSRTRIKAYLVLFVCMATKAIHCEVVTDLTTKAFLAALSRFIARRGLPLHIYSDNATNYQGAKSQLAELYNFLSDTQTQKAIQDASTKFHIQWHFIPPRAPHFGGLWEAAVKSFKRIFRVTTTNVTLDLEELMTLSTQVESILNSRPIVPLTEDPEDLNYLSPGHFLIGRPLSALPPSETSNKPIQMLTRWNRVQAMLQQIWDSWSAEYLMNLQRRQKWKTTSDNLVPDTLVLVREDNLPLGFWKLGRIVETFPGNDSKVRVASVRTASGIYKRTISRLVPLPLEHD